MGKRTNPGLAIGARAEVVQKSKMVAVQPPCKFPRRLHWEASTVKENTVVPGLEEAEMSLISLRRRVAPHP
jgi:hypothetical protein